VQLALYKQICIPGRSAASREKKLRVLIGLPRKMFVELVCQLCGDSERSNSALRYSARDERRLFDALGCGPLKEFPNPKRTGCPGSDVTKRIASRTMPLAEAEKWLDLLGSCGPCYRDFSQLREVYKIRRKRTLLAVAASVLVAGGFAGWVLLQKHNEALVAETTVLDLRNHSVARGTVPNPTEQPLEVSRAAAHLKIYLPLGSPEGPYDVRVVTTSGESLLNAIGEARLNHGVTSLEVTARLSSSRPGGFILQIRKAGSEWNSYSILLR
jgi:hypothetical protein